MDKIHILSRIEDYNGQNVHIQMQSGKSFTGHLNADEWLDGGKSDKLLVGWREDSVSPYEILEIHPT